MSYNGIKYLARITKKLYCNEVWWSYEEVIGLNVLTCSIFSPYAHIVRVPFSHAVDVAKSSTIACCVFIPVDQDCSWVLWVALVVILHYSSTKFSAVKTPEGIRWACYLATRHNWSFQAQSRATWGDPLVTACNRKGILDKVPITMYS